VTIDGDKQILIFTSPSNVEAFFEKNNILAGQKVIAMGEATAKALAKLKVKNVSTPLAFDDLGLFQAVLGVSAGS
jgi:uroporphyrinogen-III synthase